ncbi:MAG: hypothetical protein IKL62_05525 [Clostridia bacterium]|nr:hypothetical protein [Clostridia bacterium]
MAEFCYECFKKVFEKDIPIENLIMSKDLEFCEECMENKPVVYGVRRSGFEKIKYVLGLSNK